MDQTAMVAYEEESSAMTVDPQTSEVTSMKKFSNEFEIGHLLNTAGQIKLSDEQKAALYAPVKEEDVEIRPDGLVYLPWMEYASRLKEAFAMEWALIPNGKPSIMGNYVYWGFWLIVQGHLCGYALGEQQYIPNNRTMTYGDACEGAKSNALMRLCKGIGISLELWKPSFIREWIAENAESYWAKDKKGNNKQLWRKKGQSDANRKAPSHDETSYPLPDEPPSQPPPRQGSGSMSDPMTDPQRKMIFGKMRQAGLSDKEADEVFHEYLPENPTRLLQRFL